MFGHVGACRTVLNVRRNGDNMAKNGFGKFLLVTGTVAAAAIGAYYYLQSRDESTDDSGDDDYDDDFDDFDSNADAEPKTHGRTYVDLKNDGSDDADGFKEGLSAAAAKSDDKIVGSSTPSAANASQGVAGSCSAAVAGPSSSSASPPAAT